MILVDKNGNTINAGIKPANDWESQEIPYIIWYEPARLSCMLNYVMPIRILTEYNERINGLTVDIGYSETFSIVRNEILVEDNGGISLNADLLTGKFNDFAGVKHCVLEVEHNFPTIKRPYIFPLHHNGHDDISHILFTIYIVCHHETEETVLKNIRLGLIQDNREVDSAVIRIGATFYDDSEELKVIGRNMGIKLPADICKAFWNCGFDEYYPDRKEQRDKLKELLFNYMSIRGECGSYSSAYDALKWFGWGDHVELKQLISLNQSIPDMYVSCNFDMSTNLKTIFKQFRRTTYLSLTTELKEISNEIPELADSGESEIRKTEGTWDGKESAPLFKTESEDGPLWKWSDNIFENNERFINRYVYSDNYIPGFDERYSYVICELSLKLACMASFYEEYLLPVQLNVVRSSVVDHVSAAPLKLLSGTYSHTTMTAENITSHDISVNFGDMVYTVYQRGADSYIDINIEVDSKNEQGSVVIYLSSSDKLVWRTFSGWDNGLITETVNLSRIDVSPLEINHIALLIDGTWYENEISIRYPSFKIEAGKLVYRYDPDSFFDMKEPNLVTMNSIDVFNKEKDSLWWEDCDIHRISPQKFGIPAAAKNLVITADLVTEEGPVDDIFYSVDSLAASRYLYNIKTGQVQFKILDNYEYYPGSLFPGISVFINSQNIDNLLYDYDEKLEIESEHISGIIAIDIATGESLHESVESGLSIEEFFKSPDETIKSNSQNTNCLIYKRPLKFGDDYIDYALKINSNGTEIHFDYIPENTIARIFVSGLGTMKVGENIYNIFGNTVIELDNIDTNMYLYFTDLIKPIYLYGCEFKSRNSVRHGILQNICTLNDVSIILEEKDITYEFDIFLLKNIEYSLLRRFENILSDIDKLLNCNMETSERFRYRYMMFSLPPISNSDNITISALVRNIARNCAQLIGTDNNSYFVKSVNNDGELSILIEDDNVRSNIGELRKILNKEITRIRKNGNDKAPYYISAVSKYPISDIENLNIENMKQTHIEDWLHTPCNIEVSFAGSIISDKNINRSVIWSPERYIFVKNEDSDGWISNIFHKEDLVACRVVGEASQLPYFSGQNNRILFIPSSPGMDIIEEGFTLGGNANMVLLARSSSLNPYIETGYYDIKFAYTWNDYDNITIDIPGFIKII